MVFTGGLAARSCPKHTELQAYRPYTGCMADAWLMHAGPT
jgi:hypothetical protein